MARKIIKDLNWRLAKVLYNFFAKAAHWQKLKAAMPSFMRRFISKYIVKAVADAYDRERRLRWINDKSILLADYPRCGVNWLRFVLATLLNYRMTGEIRKLTIAEMGKFAPTVHSHGNFDSHCFNDGASFAKTHSHYFPEYRRAVMIYRNPFEAIKSLHTHESYTLDDVDFELTDVPKRFGVELSGEKIEGLSQNESFLHYWCQEYVTHHETWLAAIHARPSDFFVVKYEDMLEHCEKLLPAIISFVGLETPTLTNEQISMLAAMYTRRHANWRTENDIAYRNRKFRELENVICVSELERLNSGLAARVAEIRSELDSVRVIPASINGAC